MRLLSCACLWGSKDSLLELFLSWPSHLKAAISAAGEIQQGKQGSMPGCLMIALEVRFERDAVHAYRQHPCSMMYAHALENVMRVLLSTSKSACFWHAQVSCKQHCLIYIGLLCLGKIVCPHGAYRTAVLVSVKEV